MGSPTRDTADAAKVAARALKTAADAFAKWVDWQISRSLGQEDDDA